MTEEKLLELFLQSNIGKQTIKKITTLKQQNDQYQKEVIFLSHKIKELEEKLEESNIVYQTKSEEQVARDLMNTCISAYRGNQSNRYVFSMIDDNEKEIRVYSKQLDEYLKQKG